MDAFTPLHRAGSGTPLVCIHGFMDTWRTWELVLPALEREHDVLAITLAGHAGGPRLQEPVGDELLVDEAERAMDQAGLDIAHIVGNSLGGFVALQLAARGRARTVVALAPAGGWSTGAPPELLELQAELHRQCRAAAPYADAVLSTPEGRRRATRLLTVNFEHIPVGLLVHQLLGVAACAAPALLERAITGGWELDSKRISCPVRVVWGTDDALLPWPSAAARFRQEWLPHADWVVLDEVGHCPQLDVPLETAELILGFTR